MPKRGPLRMADHCNSDQAPFQILLVTEILVSCEKNFKAVVLGGNQQITVSQAFPPEVRKNGYIMLGQVPFIGTGVP